MDILGIGPLEFFFILLIALIIFGPKDMVKAGRSVGSFLRKLISSEGFKTVQKASRDVRALPNKLMREAGLEEMEADLKNIAPPDLMDSVQSITGDIDKSIKAETDEITKGLSSWTTTPETVEEQISDTPVSDDEATEQPSDEEN